MSKWWKEAIRYQIYIDAVIASACSIDEKRQLGIRFTQEASKIQQMTD